MPCAARKPSRNSFAGLPKTIRNTSLSAALRDVVSGWAAEVQALGLHAKGLWLVDFDNGEGYYCWSYPEPAITHYHGYEEGFAGRISIQ
jgi:hypothetical protein